ncbi:hypothetical protein EYF80_016428 [Liparis tanakae]|uniref:Uncharacterized protein n=1 Tax=Liparis tanakae TaxID=230148 RepID=A0A4Z2I730_9TELE|nr:hypothetical protein EYF80_016428 [Liparis tanakae]
MGCPRKKPSSSESEDEEHVEQESSCLRWPGWRVSEPAAAEPRLSLSFSPLQSRVSSRGRSGLECLECLSAPGWREGSEGKRRGVAAADRFSEAHPSRATARQRGRGLGRSVHELREVRLG